MMGYGEGSFETNPDLDDNMIVPGRHVGAASARCSQVEPLSIGGATVDSSPSEQSSMVPSFFIIPPRQTTDASVKERRKQQQQLGVIDEETDARVFSVASSSSINGCRPYRRDKIVREIESANQRGGEGHAAVLKALKDAGIMIFIIDSKVSGSISEIMDSVRNVVFHSCKVHQVNATKQIGSNLAVNQFDEQCCNLLVTPRHKVLCNDYSQNQRCLLYRDPDGRLFNLTLASHTTAIAAQWEGLLKSFSVLQAVSLLVILMRSYSCATEGKP
jgi:hypothetical protein